MTDAVVPMLSADRGLARYLNEIRQFPLLDAQQEYTLAKRWREREDREAAGQLITSHLRLVAKNRDAQSPLWAADLRNRLRGELRPDASAEALRAGTRLSLFDLRDVVDQGLRSKNTSCARGRW